MDKTKWVAKAEVQTASVLPKTLQVETETMLIGGASVPMYPVYGKSDEMQNGVDAARVWCATFLDSDEAMAWVQASRVFGRAVRGAVVAVKQESADGTTGIEGREPAEKAN